MEGFVRVAAITPKIRVADCDYNARQIIDLIKKADEQNIRLVCMPELCITGATCYRGLFRMKSLMTDAKNALERIVAETADCNVFAVVGLPLEVNGESRNAAAVFCAGKILSYVSRKAEHIFECKNFPDLKIAVEIGSDALSSIPPAEKYTVNGATIILNPSIFSETVGGAKSRRTFFTEQSFRYHCAYVHASAGYGESTTDSVYSAHNMICENGVVVAEAPPFGDGFAVTEIDLQAVTHLRRHDNYFRENNNIPHVPFSLDIKCDSLTRKISPTPFISENPSECCEEALNIQAHGLAKRLEHMGAKAVLGVSGGLDSTLALLVTVRAYEVLGLEKSEIIAVTMPCFGTTGRTKTNAHRLCEALGVPCREIDISETVRRHLHDIDHSESSRDTTFENAQARMRTLTLMDIANKENGIVIGTGSLSEIALGWATYNGDHMSMYAVNAGVPKTLARKIVENISETRPDLSSVLRDILETPVSPELLPPKDGEIVQRTEEIIGSYELHDFFIYHFLRWGRTPRQIFELACCAFENYSADEIKNSLKTFFSRFYSQQFKRNCMPDGPKVVSVSLSPRGGWRMPSDVSWNSEDFI